MTDEGINCSTLTLNLIKGFINSFKEDKNKDSISIKNQYKIDIKTNVYTS